MLSKSEHFVLRTHLTYMYLVCPKQFYLRILDFTYTLLSQY